MRGALALGSNARSVAIATGRSEGDTMIGGVGGDSWESDRADCLVGRR